MFFWSNKNFSFAPVGCLQPTKKSGSKRQCVDLFSLPVIQDSRIKWLSDRDSCHGKVQKRRRAQSWPFPHLDVLACRTDGLYIVYLVPSPRNSKTCPCFEGTRHVCLVSHFKESGGTNMLPMYMTLPPIYEAWTTSWNAHTREKTSESGKIVKLVTVVYDGCRNDMFILDLNQDSPGPSLLQWFWPGNGSCFGGSIHGLCGEDAVSLIAWLAIGGATIRSWCWECFHSLA